MKTEALWYLGERKMEMRPVEIPDPGPEDLLVELEACGICNWDIQSYTGAFGKHHPYPFSAGHEGVGRVIAVGPKLDSELIGRRVTMHELPIGTPGGPLMARHAIRRIDQAAVIPEDGRDAAMWVVEPVACVLNGIMFAGIQPGDKVAVVGAGYMGLLFVQGLHRSLTGALGVFDIDPVRLDLASAFGADKICNAGEELHSDVAGRFDVVIETAANPDSLELSMKLVKSGGIIETFAWHHHDHSFDLEDWHLRGLRFLNIQPGMNPHFGDLYPRTVALMANGTFSNEKLITHVGPIEEAREVFDIALNKSGGYIKGVLTF